MMLTQRLIPIVATTLLLAYGPAVSAQMPLPCPPVPELAAVVDTPEKCNCFYALAGSGYDAGDASTFFNLMDENTVQIFPQTGKYYGPDGIAEYLSWVVDSEFVTSFVPVFDGLVLDMTGTTATQCVALLAERWRITYNPTYTGEVCSDTYGSAQLTFSMTGDMTAPILISEIRSWLPDAFLRDAIQRIGTSEGSAEYVCDVLANCPKSPKKKRKKKGKASKAGKTERRDVRALKPKEFNKKKCLATFNELPLFTDVNGYAYLDGNTKGCRIMHSYLASVNDFHCPHVTFEDDEDDAGNTKCIESEMMLESDLFSPQTLGLIYAAGPLLGFDETGLIVVEGGGCPFPPIMQGP